MRADLQRYYGIDWDRREKHTPTHIAALVKHLPQDSALCRAYSEDAEWTLDRVLLATIANSLNMLIWGMGDKSKRGNRPQMIGPSWMRLKTRTLDAQAMPIDELLAKLSLERR